MKEGLTQKVNTPFLKALVQNLSTNTAEDFYFSLEPSQVKSSPALLAGSDPIFLGHIFQNSKRVISCDITRACPSPTSQLAELHL